MSPEDQIDAIMLDALNELGAEWVFNIQQEISDLYPPSSAASTPPHLRTGNLQANIRYAVDQFHDGYLLTILSDAEYSSFLEFGTSRMSARPYMLPSLYRWEGIIVRQLQSRFTATANPTGGGAPPINSAYGMIYPAVDAIRAAFNSGQQAA